MKIIATAIMLILLAGCAGLESDDIVKLRGQQERAKKIVAVLQRGLDAGKYCDVLLHGTRALRILQDHNQHWSKMGVEAAKISDADLHGILEVARARCQAQPNAE